MSIINKEPLSITFVEFDSFLGISVAECHKDCRPSHFGEAYICYGEGDASFSSPSTMATYVTAFLGFVCLRVGMLLFLCSEDCKT